MHTKGKLRLDDGGRVVKENGRPIVFSGVSLGAGIVENFSLEPEYNDRRLVALWNALDGVPTESLEADCVRKLVEEVRSLLNTTEPSILDYRALADALKPFDDQRQGDAA